MPLQIFLKFHQTKKEYKILNNNSNVFLGGWQDQKCTFSRCLHEQMQTKDTCLGCLLLFSSLCPSPKLGLAADRHRLPDAHAIPGLPPRLPPTQGRRIRPLDGRTAPGFSSRGPLGAQRNGPAPFLAYDSGVFCFFLPAQREQ